MRALPLPGENASVARPTTVCENYCCHLPPALFLAAGVPVHVRARVGAPALRCTPTPYDGWREPWRKSNGSFGGGSKHFWIRRKTLLPYRDTNSRGTNDDNDVVVHANGNRRINGGSGIYNLPLFCINNWPTNCTKLQIKALLITDKLLTREVGRLSIVNI